MLLITSGYFEDLCECLKIFFDRAPKPVVLIAGPTACGKSDLAVVLAKKFKGSIINADSQQLYKGLDLLTAKPTSQEQFQCPHFLYSDFLNESPGVNAIQWCNKAREIIDREHENSKIPFVTGGTGFYLKALKTGLPFIPQVPFMTWADRSTRELHQELASIDPIISQKIHFNDRQRIERALRVWQGTGKPLSFWQEEKPMQSDYSFFSIGLLPKKTFLCEKIQQRFVNLCQKGLLEEVRTYCAASNAPLSNALGLKILQAFQAGAYGWQRCEDLFLIQTWQYAKRQLVWFKGQMTFDWKVGLE